MSATSESNLYLYLGPNPIRFESLGGDSNVAIFFDQSNRQVFTARSNGTGGVVVKGPDNRVSISFRLDDRGDIISMRFSSDIKVLAIQRSQGAIDFLNFIPGTETSEYSQTCKGKGTKILGSCWTGVYEIVFVTDRGIEQYQVVPDKRVLKLVKTFSLPVNWFVWSFESSVLLLSSGSLGNTIHPFCFKLGTVVKLPKFDVEPIIAPQKTIDQRDIMVAVIYGQLYALQILHNQSRTHRGTLGTDIAMYQITKDSPATKTDVLRLNITGRLSMSILDNLVIVHHQSSKASFLFDIHLAGEVVGPVRRHRPFLDPLPVEQFRLPLPVTLKMATNEPQDMICDLYAQSCVIFPPDVVLDAKLGCFWYLHVRLEPLLSLVSDKCRLMDLLLLRRDSKSVILTLCTDILSSPQPSSLVVASNIFNKLNRVYHNHVESQELTSTSGPDGLSTDLLVNSSIRKYSIVDQSDMYTHIFSQLTQSKSVPYKFTIAIIIEYIRSLNMYQIIVQHFLYELVINTLVQHNCFYQLHQFLQYHVLSDSKHLACSLLSLESIYPPAYQLALDMLKRLSTASDAIIEVLLSKKQLLAAIRFVQNVGLTDQISARKFLEAARSTDSVMTFYAVYQFFEQRNVRLRGAAKFIPGEHCEEYVKHYQELFTDAASA